MNRSDYITVRSIDNGTRYRLDYHAAAYVGLSRANFKFTVHTIKQHEEHRPDLVALNVYGDPSYWFPLYQYNGIIDHINETVMGKQLKVPDLGQLDAYLKAVNATEDVTGTVVTL